MGFKIKKSKLRETKWTLSKNRETQSENEQNDDIECELNKLRLVNVNNIIVGDLNINSLPGKFDRSKLLITYKIDILVLTEKKWTKVSL